MSTIQYSLHAPILSIKKHNLRKVLGLLRSAANCLTIQIVSQSELSDDPNCLTIQIVWQFKLSDNQLSIWSGKTCPDDHGSFWSGNDADDFNGLHV